jgi:hypothetical protein
LRASACTVSFGDIAIFPYNSIVNGDRKGIVVAALCFVHCVAGPLLVSMGGFAALGRFSERIEPVFLISSTLIGAATLIPSYRSKHRRFLCLGLFSAGLFCLAFLRQRRWVAVPEAVLATVGASLIICAHALNHRFSRQCDCCRRHAAAADSSLPWSSQCPP